MTHKRAGLETLEKLKIYQLLPRQFSAHLSDAEVKVALHFIDQTIGFDRLSCTLTYQQIISGIGPYGGTGQARSTVIKCCNSLIAKGLLSSRKVKSSSGATVTLWTINPNWRPGDSNTPTKLQDASLKTTTRGSGRQTEGVRETDPGGPGNGPLIQVIDTDKLIQVAPGAPSALGRDQRDCDFEEGETNRDKVRPRRPGISAEAAWGAWSASWEAHWAAKVGHCPTWSEKHRHAAQSLGRFMPPCAEGGNRSQHFRDFITWSVEHWTRVIRKRFRRFRNAPTVPEIGFFINFRFDFMGVWMERELEKWLSQTERTALERHVAKGMTKEQALLEVAKAQVMVEFRDEIQQERAKLARDHRVLERGKKEHERRRLLDFAQIARVREQLQTGQAPEEAKRPAAVANAWADHDPEAFAPIVWQEFDSPQEGIT